MTRYFDHVCGCLHNTEDRPRCSRHGVNHSRSCAECKALEGRTPCGTYPLR